ncbi:cytochrome C [Sphingobium sp. EM0848]|uniref:cytochrome C n=1 Tax=Sphingobium sp. EM0848 TaxID=2743473 RepID=UPI00159C1C4B|nr:cytochrome C [Sphingobium sp. EM0848]
MKGAPLVLTAFAAMTVALAARAGEQPIPGVTNAAQAHQDYILKCQGCHRPDGGGDDRSNPPMRGIVGRFLTVPGGREFVGQVPGVATVNLDDRRLAELVNWTLHRFDAEHLPPDFRPYTAEEIGALRRNPLRLDRVATRARLVAEFENAGSEQGKP